MYPSQQMTTNAAGQSINHFPQMTSWIFFSQIKGADETTNRIKCRGGGGKLIRSVEDENQIVKRGRKHHGCNIEAVGKNIKRKKTEISDRKSRFKYKISGWEKMSSCRELYTPLIKD